MNKTSKTTPVGLVRTPEDRSKRHKLAETITAAATSVVTCSKNPKNAKPLRQCRKCTKTRRISLERTLTGVFVRHVQRTGAWVDDMGANWRRLRLLRAAAAAPQRTCRDFGTLLCLSALGLRYTRRTRSVINQSIRRSWVSVNSDSSNNIISFLK